MNAIQIKNILLYSHNKWDKHLILGNIDLSQVPMFVSQNGTVVLGLYANKKMETVKIQFSSKYYWKFFQNQHVETDFMEDVKRIAHSPCEF